MVHLAQLAVDAAWTSRSTRRMVRGKASEKTIELAEIENLNFSLTCAETARSRRVATIMA